MNTVLWIVQILVALAFLAAGTVKIVTPREQLAKPMRWVMDMPPVAPKVIGTLEVLGAIGLILPALTGILPWLTPLAAVGLVLTMIGALLVHIRHHDEFARAVAPLVLLIMAAFVVYGRFVLLPF